MFKKEYLFVFIIIGLGIAYAILSLIVLITRGKWFKAFNNRLKTGSMIVAFVAMLTSGGVAFSQAETPTPTPTPAYGTLVPTPIVPPYGLTPVPGETPIPTPPVLPPYSVPLVGDVNMDGEVDIVDALLISQHYVGLNPPTFNIIVADVDCSDKIDIVDALLVAQKYVGLILDFPECVQ